MGLPTTRSLCTKLVGEFNAMIGPIEVAANAVSSLITGAISDLKTMAFTAQDELLSAIYSLDIDINDFLPDLVIPDEITNFILRCPYLRDSDLLKNPMVLVMNLLKPLTDKIDGLISDLASTVLEFGIAGKLYQIEKMFSPDGKSLTSRISELESIISCISALCGGEYTTELASMRSRVDGVYNKMYMSKIGG